MDYRNTHGYVGEEVTRGWMTGVCERMEVGNRKACLHTILSIKNNFSDYNSANFKNTKNVLMIWSLRIYLNENFSRLTGIRLLVYHVIMNGFISWRLLIIYLRDWQALHRIVREIANPWPTKQNSTVNWPLILWMHWFISPKNYRSFINSI